MRKVLQMGKYGKGNTEWFVRDRFGMFIHWGLYSMPARHEWVRHYEKITDEDYQKYFDHFNPDLFQPREWAKTAREAGMKYVVFTTKHHEGFCMWDSRYTDYKVTNTPCGRDLVRDRALSTATLELFFIGDTLHDVEVARALGAKCILVDGGHQTAERLAASGTPVAPTLTDAVRLVLSSP